MTITVLLYSSIYNEFDYAHYHVLISHPQERTYTSSFKKFKCSYEDKCLI